VTKKLYGRRKFGRPGLKWLEDVKKNRRIMNIKKGRQRARERQGWANLLKEAKVIRVP
jgi:hypothetical protein